ncbi:hypothetical protein MKP15_04180 [Stenotrophomonas sp. Y6]|uniref:hypothetical protein n=1 Tax=Stenotrophomonas sp. Y6 TaxID=2920383 RepID=UPI001F05FAD0|nr:hypothetical protein [Stenotrophomonas sp. Y6]MCH1907970.1 hypothetical protein [Stenotrophomonas sp. Y6]
MSAIDVMTSVDLGPAELAEVFWEMDASQQADFFAKLDEIAGYKLCVQMAGVVREIQERGDRGDHAAMNGFRTMLAHAQAYHEEAMDFRVWGAQRAIARQVEAAA